MVLLVPLLPVDPSFLPPLIEPLSEAFSRTVKLVQPPPLDGSFAFNLSRNQYNSTLILSALLEKFSDWVPLADGAESKILGVTEGDLFVPVLTYVFGEAHSTAKLPWFHRIGFMKNSMVCGPTKISLSCGFSKRLSMSLATRSA